MLPDDHDILAELEVIDATLAGEPVDPVHAELAELALLLASERPQPTTEFTQRLDERVTSRFAQAPARWPAPSADGAARRRPKLLRWARRPGLIAAVTAVAVAAVVGVVVLSSGATPPVHSPAVGGLEDLGKPLGSGQLAQRQAATKAAAAANSTAAGSSSFATAGSSLTVAPAPATTSGREIVQSAQLQLSVSATRIDMVAQELFDVVGQESGIVESSQVTSGHSHDSYASFTLSIPTGNLQATMTRLSTLHYASVVSRTDSTQDVTDTYQDDQRRLADARALRTSLLRQLETADTEAEIDSLDTQIQDAEKTISSDQTTLAKLQRQIAYSSLQVQVNAASAPAKATNGSGLTIGRALHDAGRVLVFAAGVILIALAVLVPLGLIVALLAWLGQRLRRVRREHALDHA